MKKMMILLTCIFVSISIFADDPPPLLDAALKNPGYAYDPDDDFLAELDTLYTGENPPETRYIYWRKPIDGTSSALDSMSVVVAMDNYYFTGASDGDVFEYRVAAVYDGDTVWSEALWIMHDLYDPEPVPFFSAAYIGDDIIQLFWQRAWDSASGVRAYAIYRSSVWGDLIHIFDYTPDRFIVPDNGEETYCVYDDTSGIDSELTYYYTVVPIDSAGYSSLMRGHYPPEDNPIEPVQVGPPPFPWDAHLEPIPRFIKKDRYTIKLDIEHFTPRCGMVFQYRLIDLSISDTMRTSWVQSPTWDWNLGECHRYIFSARAQYGDSIKPWRNTSVKICDQYGPQCLDTDSLIAESSPTTAPGDIYVRFYIYDEANLDCGSGVMCYKLYRVMYHPDSLTQFTEFLPDSVPSGYLLWTYEIDPEYAAPDTVYEYLDPGTGLMNRETYLYAMVAYDSLGHSHFCYANQDTATVDKGVPPPILLPLPTCSPCTCLTLQIVDTSRCDITMLTIKWARDLAFTEGLSGAGPFDIHEPILSNPDDGDCHDWDTLTFEIHGLEDAQYYFRVTAFDNTDNIEKSNIVNTHIDCTPPTLTTVDSLHSLADSTRKVKIKIWWPPSYDACGGIERYDIYRSDSPTSPEILIDYADHNPHTGYYEWVDYNPNPSNNFRDNYYRVAAVDAFENWGISGIPRGFVEDGTPPLYVSIDTVFSRYADGQMWIFVEWTDSSPGFFNKYRVEHVPQNLSALFMGDTIVIDIENDTTATKIKMPRSRVTGSLFDRYFHIATIDIYGNESGYSMPYHFLDENCAACTTIVHIYPGWNMISLPVLPVSRVPEDVFHSAISVFEHSSSGYSPVDTLYIGWGYWMQSLEERDEMIVGYCVPEYTRNLSYPGWHLIGGVSDIADFCTNPDAMTTDSIWGWNGALGVYQRAGEIESGKGYWMFVCDTTTLHVPCPEFRKEFLDNKPVWEFCFTAGNQELLIGEGNDVFDMTMLPPPPGYELPTLIDDNEIKMLRDVSNDGDWTLFLPEKCVVRWNSETIPERGLSIIGENVNVDMSTCGAVNLAGGEYKIVAGENLPKKFAVKAYPNPFNSRMNIDVALPEYGDVTISILSTDGRWIGSVFEGELDAGIHHYIWDGKDRAGREVPAGVYLMRVSTPASEEIMRVLLVK